MGNTYYENLFNEGKGLHTCVIADYDCWNYFHDIQRQHKNFNVHTFKVPYTYIESYKRIKSASLSYKNYDLIICSTDALFKEDTLESLQKIAAEISDRKRVTLCYLYVNNDKESSSYVIESFSKGEKSYTDTGMVDEELTTPIDVANYLAELHVNLIEQKRALSVKEEQTSRKNPVAVQIKPKELLRK